MNARAHGRDSKPLYSLPSLSLSGSRRVFCEPCVYFLLAEGQQALKILLEQWTGPSHYSLQGWGHRIDCGDVDKAFASGECDHVIEGEVKMGGQEHFYLEPQGSVIIPLENDEMVVIASTQVRLLSRACQKAVHLSHEMFLSR